MRRVTTSVALILTLVLSACSQDSNDPSEQDPSEQADQDSATSAADSATNAEPSAPSSAQPPASADPEATSAAPTSAESSASATGDSGEGEDADSTQEAQQELPRGGTEFFPHYRLFGYSGAPGAEAFGRLGIGDLDDRAAEIVQESAPYAGVKDIMPTLELIATVAHPTGGADGMFRTHVSDDVVEDYLEAARAQDGLLLLNIQPGRADFIDEVERWEHWLTEPDVGVALDPEWAVGDGQVPGQVYGRTDGAELNQVATYLSELVAEHDLPEKMMVYHQVHASVVQDEGEFSKQEGVAAVKSVDGIGAPADKIGTYERVLEGAPEHVTPGFKLFFEEDAEVGPLMTPEEVLNLNPVPQYILWE